MSNSITDLTNTSWKLNSTISAPSGYGDFYIDHSISLPDGTTASDQKRFAVGYGLHNWWGLTPTQDNIISFKKLYFIEDVLPALESEYVLSTGDIIKITGGQDVTNASLISWLSENAQQVFDSECSFDYDDFWIQKDCHWDYDRIFTVTTKIKDSGSPYFYYKLGPKDDSILSYTAVEPNDIRIKGNTYTYDLKLSKLVEDFGLSNLLDSRSDDGWLTITALVRINGQSLYFEYDHFLELAPVMEAPEEQNTNVIQTSWVYTNPGEIKCSWQPAKELDGSTASYSPDDLDGYSIEVFRCPKELDHTKPENFTRLSGLKWKDANPETGIPTTGVYKLIKDPDYTEPEFTELPTDNKKLEELLNNDFYMESPYTKSEARIENPLKTEFFFNPKHLDIKPSDHYKFVIRPYSHYGATSLISSEGLESEVYKVRQGFVHVKTENGWEAGQVWVYTQTKDGPKWVVAEYVYVAAAGETEGTITWKQAQ